MHPSVKPTTSIGLNRSKLCNRFVTSTTTKKKFYGFCFRPSFIILHFSHSPPCTLLPREAEQNKWRRRRRQCKFIVILFFPAPGIHEKVVNVAKFIWNPSILYFSLPFPLFLCVRACACVSWSFCLLKLLFCGSGYLATWLKILNRFKSGTHLCLCASRFSKKKKNSKQFFVSSSHSFISFIYPFISGNGDSGFRSALTRTNLCSHKWKCCWQPFVGSNVTTVMVTRSNGCTINVD